MGMTVNLETDTVSIVRSTSGTETILTSVSHDFKNDGEYRYILELWFQGTDIRAFVNGFNVASYVTGSFRTSPGFSLHTGTINFSDLPRIYEVKAFELTEQNEQALEFDPSNLLVDFRKRMKEEIENPAERTWATYIKARKLYDKYKDQGFKNETWEEFGYPIQKPSSEEWFAN